jgi:hypothetical protein
MAEFVGDHVEIESKGDESAVAAVMGADLQIAVTRMGIVESGKYDNFQAVKISGEVPRDSFSEIPFPYVENEADRAKDMRLREFRRPQGDVVKMTGRVGLHGPPYRAASRRKIEKRSTVRARIDALGHPIADGIDQKHAFVGRTRAY